MPPLVNPLATSLSPSPSPSCCLTLTHSPRRDPEEPDFHDRRAREHYAASAEGRGLLRQRLAVEHAIGRLKNRGAGAARYCGRVKTRAQWLWSAAVANFTLAWGKAAPEAL